MDSNSNSSLMLAVQKILKRHKTYYKVVNESTLHLDGFPLNMYPVLKMTDDGISFICPIAYYMISEQRDAILDCCNNNRRVGYSVYGWHTFFDECDDSGKVTILPGCITFEDQRENLLIVARTFIDGDSFYSKPEELYELITLIDDYASALRSQKLPQIIYSRMVKTNTDPSDPRSLLYCFLLLTYRKAEAKPWMVVDFNDVKVALRNSREIIFYPSLSAKTFDVLIHEIEKSFYSDLLPEEPFVIVVTLTLPNIFRSEKTNAYSLGMRLRPNNALVNIYLADDDHPFTAEMVLIKRNR